MTASGRVVCLGEPLLRLTAPGGELLLQQGRLDVCAGGAEVNVAVALAHLGHDAKLAAVFPDNPLGHATLGEIRRHGVDVSAVRFGKGRMGLYFMSPGAVVRPSDILYDREASAFALAAPDTFDWNEMLHGAQWLHVSGVTPAVSKSAGDAALAAVKAAERLGVSVSFDGNYRAKMWAARGEDGAEILHALLKAADIAFLDERDVGLVLKKSFSGEDATERRSEAAEAAFAAFPKLKRIASTFRKQNGVANHGLSAIMFTRARQLRTRDFDLPGVVERIGAGDAFAAGVLHGLMSKKEDLAALAFGLAAACLKHSFKGDFNLAGAADVERLLAGDGIDVRR